MPAVVKLVSDSVHLTCMHACIHTHGELYTHMRVVVKLLSDSVNPLHAELAERGHQRIMQLLVLRVDTVLCVARRADGRARAVKVVQHRQELRQHLDARVQLRLEGLVDVPGAEVIKVALQPRALLGPLFSDLLSFPLRLLQPGLSVRHLLLENL